MVLERAIRVIAGSLALGRFVTPWAYLFTAFVGLNLLQSGITKWCLMEDVLAKFGLRRCDDQPRERADR